jgi:hypothetical protein
MFTNISCIRIGSSIFLRSCSMSNSKAGFHLVSESSARIGSVSKSVASSYTESHPKSYSITGKGSKLRSRSNSISVCR